jgi:hypothetical protein
MREVSSCQITAPEHVDIEMKQNAGVTTVNAIDGYTLDVTLRPVKFVLVRLCRGHLIQAGYGWLNAIPGGEPWRQVGSKV